MIFKSSKSKLNSLIAKKMGKNDLLQSDPRIILDEASRVCNQPIESILNFVSSKINIPICKVIPEFSPSQLPEEVNMPLLWEKGFSPIMIENQIVGIASSNPTILKDLPRSLLNLPIFLSSWGSVSNRLYNSEKIHRKVLSGSADKLASAILAIILEEAKRCNTSKIILHLLNAEAEYHLEIFQKNRAVGKIANDGREAILSYLSNLNSNEIEFYNNGVNEKFNIKSVALGYEILLHPIQEQSNLLEFPTTKTVYKSPIILLVDDDKSFLTVTERFLMQNGFVAKSFLSSNSCLEALDSEKFDPFVIITDMHMQDSTGVEFINKIKRNSRLANIPVIGLSGDEHGETELALLESGAAYVVMKRGDPRILLHLIKRFQKPNDLLEALP